MKTKSGYRVILILLIGLGQFFMLNGQDQNAFIIHPDLLDIPDDGGTVELSVSFVGEPVYWTVTTESDWLVVTPSEGEGATELVIACEPNTGLGRRTTLVFSTPDSEVDEFHLLVRQYHSVPPEDLSFNWKFLEFNPLVQENMPNTGQMQVWLEAWEPAVFMNIVARKEAGDEPQWIIKNLYIPESELYSGLQNLTCDFNLGLLGFEVGEPVEYLEIAYSLDVVPDITMPIIPDPAWREAIFEWDKMDKSGYQIPPGFVYNGFPLDHFFPETLGNQVTNKHYIGCEMYNGDLDAGKYPWQINGCGPAAAANSLMWLRDKHEEIDFPGDFYDVCRDLAALMGKRAHGVNLEGFIQGKLDFIEMYDLPIKVKYQSKQFKAHVPSDTKNTKAEKKDKSDNTHPDKDWIYEELRDGEDVEMGFVYPGSGLGHIAVVTGIYTIGDSTYIYFKDDDNSERTDSTDLAQSYSALEWRDSIWALLGEQGAVIQYVVSESYDPDHESEENEEFFSKYCQSIRKVLDAGESISLKYPEAEGRNFNTTLRFLDKVSGDAFETLGMWVNNSGKTRKIKNSRDYPVVVELHNDDINTNSKGQKTGGWRINLTRNPHDAAGQTDPSNEYESAGFSVGSDDESNDEFGEIVGNEVVYVDSIGASLGQVPQRIGPAHANQLTLMKEVTVWSRYWMNLELVVGINEVFSAGNLYLSSQALGFADTISVVQPGEWVIPIGGLFDAGVFDFSIVSDGALDFSLDNIGFPTTMPIMSDMEIFPRFFEVPAELTTDTSFMITNPGGESMTWSLDYSFGWFAAQPRNGVDEQQVRLFIVPNDGSPRMDSIRIFAEGVEHSVQYVVISQDGDHTGIDDLATEDFNVSIYPNPVSQTFYLQMKDFTKPEVEIVIYNSMGEVVSHQSRVMNTNRAHVEVDFSNHPKGIYFVRVRSDAQQKVKKILKIN